MTPGSFGPPGLWRIRSADDTHAAGEAARAVLDARVRRGAGRFGLALSGGRIAPTLYRELVRQSGSRSVALRDVDFFWADERCVDPAHEDSNYRVARQELLEPIGADGLRVHRLEGELPPEKAVDRALARWEAWLKEDAGRCAAPDCIILGVGEDGHVASLFPGNLDADLRRMPPYAAVVGPKPPPQRLTMTYPMLWNAGLVVVLATGAGKASVVEAALGGDRRLPFCQVLEGRRDLPTLLIT